MTFKYYNTTREVLTLFLTAIIEPIIYHPLIVFFSMRGYLSFISSRELAWGTMTRQGFDCDESENDGSDSENDGNKTKEKKASIFERLKKKKVSGDFKPFKT